ncbi:unnamed protein product [Cylindrotheca closterium]|uniref:Uncharacterized protein n=1 Tax=Cylindrotheca closterium TaxID=2856 RepID=A0AAD2CT40_9STRA|nr:unnamed protein product [Cylindrotheca closterium]
MKLFRKKKPKEGVPRETDELFVVKLTQSTSTEASSSAEQSAVGKDVMDNLEEQGYDPDNGGRLMLLESISYETGDRYAMRKSYPEEAPQDEQRDDYYSWEDDESSRDVGNSESRDSTLYTVDTQKNSVKKNQEEDSTWSSPRRPINRHDSNCSANKLQTSWSLKSAESIAGDNIYHSDIKGPAPSNSSIPSFLNRVKSTPLDDGCPADPPGQFLDKYRQLDRAQSKEVSVLSMNGVEAAKAVGKNSENIASSVSATSSGNGFSCNSNTSTLSSSASESALDSSGDSSEKTPSTILDDESQVSNNPWRWFSRPAASFRSRRKKESIKEESPETEEEYNKHRRDMAFQTAPSFVTGTFVSSSDKSNHIESNHSQEEGAVECMIVPEQVTSSESIESFEPAKNLPPTPTKKDRGEHFKAVQEYWDAKVSSNGCKNDIARLPTFDPEVQSSMSLEDSILKQAMSMGSLDVIPVPRKSRKPLVPPKTNEKEEKPTEEAIKSKKSQSKKVAKNERPIDINIKTTRKEKAVEVAIEQRQSRLSKLKSHIGSSSSSSSSRSSSSRSSSRSRKMKSFFKKKKKTKYFEGVLEESTQSPMSPLEEMEKEQVPPTLSPVAKPDPIPLEPAAVLRRVRAQEPQQPSLMVPVFRDDSISQQSSCTPLFDVPRDVMLHPDLGQDTMEEERMADEFVGFVRLIPVALMSYFKKNPNEDELILSLQPKSRNYNSERRSSVSMQDSRSTWDESRNGLVGQEVEYFTTEEFESATEDSQKNLNFMELTPSVVGDSLEEETRGDSEEESDRTEKRRGGILRKLGKKKSDKKTCLSGHLRTSRKRQEAIDAMAEKEIKQNIEEGVEMIAGVTKQGQKAIVISNTKRHPNQYLEQAYHA